MRLLTRNGHDWTDHYPLIVETALCNRSSSFVIDGEAVLLGADGISDFDGLHSRQHDDEVQLYAFDARMLDGDDLRKLPLSMRKTNLASQGEKSQTSSDNPRDGDFLTKTAPARRQAGAVSGFVFWGKDMRSMRRAANWCHACDKRPHRLWIEEKPTGPHEPAYLLEN